MTPTEEVISKITAPVDVLLAQVVAAVGRIEQKHASEDQDLLALVAAKIESDPRFRAAVVMLACD